MHSLWLSLRRGRHASLAGKLFWIGIAVLLVACGPSAVATPVPVTIRIAGSTAPTPALRNLMAAYSRHHPNVAFDLRGGGSTLGEEWIAAGEYDMVVSTLFVSSTVGANTALDEGAVSTATTVTATPRAIQEPLVRSIIGLDGLAIVVHPANSIESITLMQLRDLYSGHILNWSEVGGRDDEVLLVSREDGSGVRAHFETSVMGDEPVSLTAVVMPTHEDVVRYVAAHPQALGYVSRGYVNNVLTGAEDDPSVQVLAVDGVHPLIENLLDQSYPLIYPLQLITRRDSNPQVTRFLEFVLSPAGQEIISRHYAPIR